MEISWSRIISFVDEAAAALVRTAFSPIIREAEDYAVVLFDAEGNSLAQSTTSAPSFIGTLPMTMRHFLAAMKEEGWHPGDVVITNDPWIGSGHLQDISMIAPVFSHTGRPVAFSGVVAHPPDMGGRWSAENREIYEEGLQIPILKLMKRGEPNRGVFNIIRRNVRVPDQVIGERRGDGIGVQRPLPLSTEGHERRSARRRRRNHGQWPGSRVKRPVVVETRRPANGAFARRWRVRHGKLKMHLQRGAMKMYSRTRGEPGGAGVVRNSLERLTLAPASCGAQPIRAAQDRQASARGLRVPVLRRAGCHSKNNPNMIYYRYSRCHSHLQKPELLFRHRSLRVGNLLPGDHQRTI